MCLAVPMQLVERSGDDQAGTVERQGVRHAVMLPLVPEAKVGDWLIVHAGYAIEVLDEAEAESRLKLFSELA